MRRAAGVVAVVIGSAAVLSCAPPPLRGPGPVASDWINCPKFDAPDATITLTEQGGTFTSGDVTLVVPENTVVGTTTVRMMLPRFATPKFPAGVSFDREVRFQPGKTATVRVSVERCPPGQMKKIWLWNVDELTSPLPRKAIQNYTVVSTLYHLSTYLLASSQ